MTLPVTTDLYAHYSAKSLDGVVSDGGSVTEVPDLGPNEFDLTGTATFHTGVLNGHPVLRGNGSSHVLTAQDMSGIDQPYTVFVVWKSNETSGTDKTVLGADDNPSGSNGFLIRARHASDADTVSYWFGSTDSSLENIPSDGFAEHVYTSIRSGTQKDVRENGVKVAPTGASEGGGERGLRRLSLFARVGGSNHGAGDIAEVIVYSRRLDLAEVESVESYLDDEWAEGDPSDDAEGSGTVVAVGTLVGAATSSEVFQPGRHWSDDGGQTWNLYEPFE